MYQKILCVGLNCFDIIQICKNYPLEDSEQRYSNYFLFYILPLIKGILKKYFNEIF